MPTNEKQAGDVGNSRVTLAVLSTKIDRLINDVCHMDNKLDNLHEEQTKIDKRVLLIERDMVDITEIKKAFIQQFIKILVAGILGTSALTFLIEKLSQIVK